MVDLPPYIRALVSPGQSPQMTCPSPPRRRTSAVPDGIEGATDDSGISNSLDFLSNNSFHQSECSAASNAFDGLVVFSDPIISNDGEQNQAYGGLWETLLDETLVAFSPGRRSFMPTPSGRDIHATHTEIPSPLMQQMTSIPSNILAAQSVNNNDLSLSDLNLDLDFSMFLNSPYRPSTASSSPPTQSHPRRSVERMSISPLRLTDHDGTHRENREFNLVPRSTSAAGQPLEPVTEQDLEAESIVSLLALLKSLVFPQFNTASQKYQDENSVLSNLFCPHYCKWLCFQIEGLLEQYLERSLKSIRKRRTAKVGSSLSSGCNFNLNERRQSLEPSDRSQRRSKTTEATKAINMRSTFFHHCSTPTGEIIFEAREGRSSPGSKDKTDSNHLIIISFMPWARERTPGLRLRLYGEVGEPSMPPQIDTFNVVPDDSAIIQYVSKGDLKGIQTLFNLRAASARDVDSQGVSLLYVGIACECE